MHKGIKSIFIAAVITIGACITVYAGEWASSGNSYIENGTTVKNQWVKTQAPDDWRPKAWYYFDKNGNAATEGWREINGKWYYFGRNNQMLEHSITPDGYYVGDDGAWIPSALPSESWKNLDKYFEGNAHIGFENIVDRGTYYEATGTAYLIYDSESFEKFDSYKDEKMTAQMPVDVRIRKDAIVNFLTGDAMHYSSNELPISKYLSKRGGYGRMMSCTLDKDGYVIRFIDSNAG